LLPIDLEKFQYSLSIVNIDFAKVKASQMKNKFSKIF
jgi:hypothetical protein